MDNQKNAVIYCRVSTEEQAKFGYSLQSQEKICRSYAIQNGFIVIKVFIEEGKSAKNLNRPELQKLMGFVEQKINNVSALIIYTTDRLSRNTSDFLIIDSLLRKNKIALLSPIENIDDTSFGRFSKTLRSAIAQLDNDTKGDRTRSGMREAIKQGRWLWNLQGYTFGSDNLGKRLLFPNDKATYVIKAFDLAEKGVYAQLEIVRMLKLDGFNISKQTLCKTLLNPVYCGLLPDKYNQNNGEYIKAIHTPLIKQETYFRVLGILTNRHHTVVPKRRNNPLFPLRRCMICSICKKIMTGSVAQGKKIRVPYYHCQNKGCPRFQKKVVEAKYLEYLERISPNKGFLPVFKEIVLDKFEEKVAQAREYIRKTEKGIADLKIEKIKIMDLLIREVVNEKDGKERLNEINSRIAEKEILINENKDSYDFEEGWRFAEVFINNVASIWKNGDLDLKQRIQGLITPAGFEFTDNLIKPLKTPYFISIFQSNQPASQIWGG